MVSSVTVRSPNVPMIRKSPRTELNVSLFWLLPTLGSSAGTTGRISLPAGPSRIIFAFPEGLTELSVCAIAFNKLIPIRPSSHVRQRGRQPFGDSVSALVVKVFIADYIAGYV